jgi:hypothetical protein
MTVSKIATFSGELVSDTAAQIIPVLSGLATRLQKTPLPVASSVAARSRSDGSMRRRILGFK